jgi:DNA-binding NtrC family response regulator
MKKESIALISSDARSISLRETLNGVLVGLGFTNIDMLEYDDLTSADINYSMLILILSHRPEMRVMMRSAFECLKMMPVLCVIQSPEYKLNVEFLYYCNEFLCWPCPENEFLFRLKRLHNAFRPISEQSIGDKMLEEFIGLKMIGNSPPFLHVLRQIKKIARYEVPVLIEGETGTGKEVAARAIHYLSKRRDYPFIPVNCGAIPDSLLESELFGHEKGAFTDAKTGQEGLISQAEGGTLFLDEVEVFSPKGQIVLLRFLQDQQYRSLGSSLTRQADVRIIAASNVTLSNMTDKGRFRQDLLYRLSIMLLKMPSLSQRTGDIEMLAKHFLDRYRLQYGLPEKFLHPETIQWMLSYHWPGNVRELKNMILRELLLTNGPSIKLKKGDSVYKDRRNNMLDRRNKLFPDVSFNEAKTQIISQFEKKYLEWLINETNGNVTQAAKLAGKERRAFGKLLKKYGIVKDCTTII